MLLLLLLNAAINIYAKVVKLIIVGYFEQVRNLLYINLNLPIIVDIKEGQSIGYVKVKHSFEKKIEFNQFIAMDASIMVVVVGFRESIEKLIVKTNIFNLAVHYFHSIN